MNEKKIPELKDIQDIIKQLDAIEPIMTFEQPTKDDERVTNEALARMFSDAPLRNYLKNRINRQIVRAAASENEKELFINSSRVLVLKELYRSAERAYLTLLAPAKK